MIAALIVERKKFFWIDCRGASISDGFGCRVRRGSSGATFSFERGAAAITLDIHLEDGGVMDETIDRGERHGGVRKYLVPFAKWLIGGDEQRASFVAGADELEQHAGLGLVLGDIGEIIEDEEIEAVEPIDGGLEIELAAGDLELLNEVGSAVKSTRHPFSIKARPSAAPRWLFPPPGGPNRSKLAPLPNQPSPAASAVTCAFETIGTASKSKLSRVFPGGSRASARWRSMRRRPRSASSCSAMVARKRAAGHPSLSDCSANCGHRSLMAGSRSSFSRRERRAASTAWIVLMRRLRSRQ